MGIMPPYDPLTDPSLAWAIVRVESIEPATPTWSRPARVVLAVDEVLRGEVPAQLEVMFGAPREAQQQRFYIDRGNGPPPWDEATQARSRAAHAELDARPVDVPHVGARIAVWLSRLDDHWDIPTLRSFGAGAIPMQSRWVDEDHLAALRALIRR
ncbi:MAG: hypothetical protein J0L92_37255 [Deltaproteobacteria bacterium]|nr:hypothetical protein [Deltaproteobacteria bacterium]